MTESLKSRLQRLQQSVAKSTVSEEVALAVDTSMVSLDEAMRELGFSRTYRGAWLRIVRYDALSQHGSRRFCQLMDMDTSILTKLAKVDDEIVDLRFYDAETTGLGSGAGTFSFLHTIGRLCEDEFCLFQYFVSDFSAERAALEEIRDTHFQPEQSISLVTYNGKSYDWPLLQNRMILHRIQPMGTPPHIDLLHISRRLWRRALGQVTLTAVESFALQLKRINDVSGKEAPTRYFSFLTAPNPEVINPVLQHNGMDVCSLATLLIVVGDYFSGIILPESSEPYEALAKWYDEWSMIDEASLCYERASQSMDARWQTLWQEAMFYKRLHQIEQATQIWSTMIKIYPTHVVPLIELAKVAEHEWRDYGQAREFVSEALLRLQVSERPQVVVERELLHRRARILRKLQKDEQA